MREFVLAVICIALMHLLTLHPEALDVSDSARITVGFGFLLVTAYIIGRFFSRIKLPKISGYLAAGMLFGPFVLGYFNEAQVGQMKFINQLALTFIALNAGGELRLKTLAARKRTLFWLLAFIVVLIFIGISTFVFAAREFIPFIAGRSFQQAAAVAALMGTLAIARSPSSVIAIIQECRAKGAFSETVLGVTVIIDFLVILLFAVVVSICNALLNTGTGFDLLFLAGVGLQVVASVFAGVIIGAGVALYIRKITLNLPILILVLSYLIYSVSVAVSHLVTEATAVSFHLEPLLIAITAGFYIQNYTTGGPKLIESIEKSALPVYVLFFTLAGLMLDLGILARMIHLAVIIVVIRSFIALISGYLAGKASGAPDIHAKLFGFGFITQAGVSIGLATEIMRRFPEWGVPLGTLLIAVINFNQIIGPIAFKYALGRVGEIRIKPSVEQKRAKIRGELT